MATNKGYFGSWHKRNRGHQIISGSSVCAGRLNMVAGGISAGYFNAVRRPSGHHRG
jgi:hypothetical protein